jgi:hypothetical protein
MWRVNANFPRLTSKALTGLIQCDLMASGGKSGLFPVLNSDEARMFIQ